MGYLREEKLWGNDDPLFPATRIALGADRQFEVSGLEREALEQRLHLFGQSSVKRSTAPVCRISIRTVIRNTLVRLGQEVCKSPEEFKAWSQNLGHEKVLTTFLSYGAVACDRQGEILRGMATPQQAVQSGAD